MTRILTFALGATLLAFASPAGAYTAADLMPASPVVTAGLIVLPTEAQVSAVQSQKAFQVARRGADDPAGDDRRPGKGGKGRGGHDDGPNHT